MTDERQTDVLRGVRIAQIVTLVAALIAIGSSVVLYFASVDTAQHRDCETLKALVIEATPANRITAARAFIRHSPELHNC